MYGENELVRRGAEIPALHERVQKLKSFIAAMKRLEPKLNDELHEQVTIVLVELPAYNVMRLLHELQTERARVPFARAC
jgi:hypothetical protein